MIRFALSKSARLSAAVGTLALAGLTTATASAATFRFETAPFAGTNASNPGRQIIGNELFIPTFNVATDKFSFDPAVFNVSAPVDFLAVGGIPIQGGSPNVVIELLTDNDENPATAFGAGTAANLIAETLNVQGAGFFVYFNSGLQLPRLVYSADLNDPTADLKILARLTDATGQAGIDRLSQFSSANFEIVAVPEPTALATAIPAVLCLARRRRA